MASLVLSSPQSWFLHVIAINSNHPLILQGEKKTLSSVLKASERSFILLFPPGLIIVASFFKLSASKIVLLLLNTAARL